MRSAKRDLSSTTPSITTESANQDLHALQAITDTALSHLSQDDLLTALLERITDILQVDNAAVLLVDAAGETLTVQAVRGLLEPVAPKVRIPVGQGFAGRIAATREPVVVDDITAFPVFNPSFREQLHSLAGVPLVLGEQVLGVVHIGTVQPRHFTDSDVQLLQQVADRMALAIDRARLYAGEKAARAEAEQQAAQLAATFEAMADGVVVFDAAGHLIRQNTAQQRLLGIDTAPPDFADLTLPERLALFAAQDEHGRPLGLDEGPLPRALRGEILSGAETMNLRSRTLDGREVELNVSAAPLRDKEGHVSGAVAVFRDQTERKQMEQALHESEARYRGVVESQTELISRYLPDTTLTFVNEANCRSMGLSREQLVGTKFMDLLPESAREPVRARIRSLLAHPGVSTMEHQVRMADGSLRWQQWVDRTVLDDTGQVIELQGVGRDVTERKQMEQRLHESEARYRATFDSAAIGVAIVDLAGRPLEVNEYVCRMLGYTGDELCTMALQDFTHPDDVAENEGLLRRVLDGEIGSYQIEKRYLHKDGHIVWGRVSAGLVHGQDGTPVYFVVHLEDITPRKQLEQERAEQAEQLDRIFEHIADGLLVHNAQGQPVRLNAAARRILGLDVAPGDYAQLPASDHATLYEAYDEQGRRLTPEGWPLMRILSGQVTEPHTREMRLRTLNGREVEVIYSLAPLRDQEAHVVGAVTILHDQTEQKRLAREREEARAHELALEDTTRHMDEFLATASHDLRTPLTVVKTRLQMALRRLTRLQESEATAPLALAETDREALQASLLAANQSGDRLVRLVDMLFDVSRARSGTLELELGRCDLAALVREQVAAQKMATPDRTIDLILPDTQSVWAQADADRLGQVLSNYLSNALKYSRAEQPVMVQLEVSQNQAVVKVTDHGPGLPEEEQSRIWEWFYRVPGILVQYESGESSGSLGLGLHICRQMVELHPGGRVGVASVVGEGSTFWFQLPLAS